MFAFKKQVYAQQAVDDRRRRSTSSRIDVRRGRRDPAARTSSHCYLRDESLADVRKDLEEGQRLGVKSTPTYFIDGTEITWIEDKVMEDFLRTKDPTLKSIEYSGAVAQAKSALHPEPCHPERGERGTLSSHARLLKGEPGCRVSLTDARRSA